MQSLFWMLYCAAAGFTALYLQGRGLNVAQTGIVTAVFGGLAAILQPVAGSLCDRYFVTWKTMELALCFLIQLVCIFMLIIHGVRAGAFLMGLLILIGNLIMPFINSAHFYYSQHGEKINFGVARGMGSGMYAFMAMLIGILTKNYGIDVIPLIGIVMSVLFIATVFRMPCTNISHAGSRTKRVKKTGFFMKYQSFTVMLLACCMMLTSHNITGTYLIQIIQSLGGSSSNLGAALAVQAVVEVPVLFCFSKIVKYIHPDKLMVLSATGFVLKAVSYAVSGNIMMIYLAQLTQMVSFAIFASASVYYTAEMISREDQATGQACMTGMLAAGTVLGSLTGGWVLQYMGLSQMLCLNIAVSVLGVILAAMSVRQAGRPLLHS